MCRLHASSDWYNFQKLFLLLNPHTLTHVLQSQVIWISILTLKMINELSFKKLEHAWTSQLNRFSAIKTIGVGSNYTCVIPLGRQCI